MAVQQQMATFADDLGPELAQANAEHKDKPIDTGNRRLPAGIRNGIARVQTMYTKKYDANNKQGLAGKTFFYVGAVVLSPEECAGEKIMGRLTSKIVPLCTVPARGAAKERSLSDNWFEFQNLFKMFGVLAPDVPVGSPDANRRIQDYYIAAMKMLNDPVRMRENPIYISFSTRGWTPPPTLQQPKPEEIVFEEWHGRTEWAGSVDPGAGVVESPVAMQPALTTPAPVVMGNGAMPTSVSLPRQADETDPADLVAMLVETLVSDPEGMTAEAEEAATKLSAMAYSKGWTQPQIAAAADWAAVGSMALSPPTQVEASPQPTRAAAANAIVGLPGLGSRWMFSRRKVDGSKLVNTRTGEEFPPVEVEVLTVDNEARTCTVKGVKDDKPLVDVRSKQPIQVKFEWLDKVPF